MLIVVSSSKKDDDEFTNYIYTNKCLLTKSSELFMLLTAMYINYIAKNHSMFYLLWTITWCEKVYSCIFHFKVNSDSNKVNIIIFYQEDSKLVHLKLSGPLNLYSHRMK